MNAPQTCALLEGNIQPDIDTLFLEHLPIRLTPIKRLHAAQIRKSYTAGLIDSTTVVRLCELIKSPSFTTGSVPEQVFMEILGLSSVGKNTSVSQRKFVQELVEWRLMGVLGEQFVDIIKKEVLEAKEEVTAEWLEELRDRYSIRTTKILDGVRMKSIPLDFRAIPPEIIPFLSEEVRRFMLEASRKNTLRGKERFNEKMIHHSQNKALEASLSYE